MIIDHNHPLYKKRWEDVGINKYNGAYYYSKEIVKNIIPRIDTDRNWITVNIPRQNAVPQFGECGCDHAIVFIHNNLHPDHYDWLKRYKDLVLVCGIPETCSKVAHLGMPIYLPLSVDVEYVKKFQKEKTKGKAFVGRMSKRKGIPFPDNVDVIEGLPRPKLLAKMAEYSEIFAVGRTAIEAKVLGCKVLPMPRIMDDRFPDPDIWKVLDNKDASEILQKQLNMIDL